MNWQTFFILIICLTACHPDKNKTITSEELRFVTTDASEIYFKNVRQSDYQIEERPEAGMNLFSLDDLNLSNEMKPVIIVNWRADMAFFYFQQDSSREGSYLDLKIGTETYTYDLSNQKSHAELARVMYNSILSELPVMVADMPIFQKPEQRESFRRMYFDYLRLVDIR